METKEDVSTEKMMKSCVCKTSIARNREWEGDFLLRFHSHDDCFCAILISMTQTKAYRVTANDRIEKLFDESLNVIQLCVHAIFMQKRRYKLDGN